MDYATEGMEVLPDAIQGHILGFVRSARDVASCSCVSKKWREAMTQVRSLYFARNVGDEQGILPDLIVTRMVLSMTGLQELIVYCPFSNVSLLAWLKHTKGTLKILELRVDDLGEKRMGNSSMSKLDCVALSTQLHTLRLWGVLLTHAPAEWRCFHNLHTLEIVGARLRDSALCGILHACPYLTNFTLLGCEGIRVACIELERLTNCRLDLYGAGKVKKLDVGRLPELQSLSLRGVHWHWEAIHTVLQSATELRELSMRVEFCGDADKLEPFPEIDFVDFFKSHPKLRSFEAQGAMFAAVANRNSLKQLSPACVIPCLEEAWVTIRSPLNADYKLASLEALSSGAKV
ncbi:hypothetical protein AXG93_2584s1040 [Marchantia polymorpha subsp. ruderalis]|uniref:F-box domain-containing protein n=1 Tax=Marchantia polymorpha subsp. ruderalis TaxID=1480154 RepID=A0A176VGP1_MARPO|nr:hypothetical protein AXG93_2584s1040 [Marchantia polymorpha subsp. ruderalis]